MVASGLFLPRVHPLPALLLLALSLSMLHKARLPSEQGSRLRRSVPYSIAECHLCDLANLQRLGTFVLHDSRVFDECHSTGHRLAVQHHGRSYDHSSAVLLRYASFAQLQPSLLGFKQ